ncbi:MAG: 23S rRNA (adenine(2503)-C(2))-methyltransferase RlmN [Planctomycetia bacterium]|nr:23S rRNA (adenine(2503)-C(2))-methyltransferase RlmN [Planctomycetia bacterium]
MTSQPLHLLDPAVLDGLEPWLAARGHGAYRAAQVRRWLFDSAATTFDEMTDLPAALRAELAAEFTLFSTRIATHSQSPDGTEKLLLELCDGEKIECVLLRDGLRRTICISSQVGCAMGCVFCASGLDGVVRNLTAGEIVEQMLRLARLLDATNPPSSSLKPQVSSLPPLPSPGPSLKGRGVPHAGSPPSSSSLQPPASSLPRERLSHIVVMGMGEPLANVDRLLPALKLAERPDALGISARRITISTVGLPPAIDRLTDEKCRYNLAVSLHAADDELRTQLVPVNRQVGLTAILSAADRYFAASGRRLTFEYVLLGEVNDSAEDARRLAGRLRGRAALLNVIPYNPVAGLPYRTPSAAAQKRFLDVLTTAGINVHVRRRKGSEIDAACGQLRRLKLNEPNVVVLK